MIEVRNVFDLKTLLQSIVRWTESDNIWSREHRKPTDVFVRGGTFCLPFIHLRTAPPLHCPLSFSFLPFLIISPLRPFQLRSWSLSSPLSFVVSVVGLSTNRTTASSPAQPTRWGRTLHVRAMSEVEQNASELRPLHPSPVVGRQSVFADPDQQCYKCVTHRPRNCGKGSSG